MSTDEVQVQDDDMDPRRKYFGKLAGEDRFVNFAEMMLDIELTDVQEEILRAVHNHKRLVVVSGNGVGKTFVVAALEVAFLYTHYNVSVMHTSRSNSQIRQTTYQEIREFVDHLQEEHGFPGNAKKMPMEIEFEDSATRSYEAISPSNPDGLEGRHNDNFLMVVDEADKPEIDEDVIDAAESTLTDGNDRMVVIGNPPRTKSNTLYDLMESEYWHTIQFSSFDSDNVKIAAGEKDGEMIRGPVQLEEIKRHWDKLHDEEWPGYEAAKNSHERDDLAEAWYRRRLGIIPPDNATRPRPFYSSEVSDATDRWENVDDEPLDVTEYDALAVDVAGRGEDSTVVVGVTDERVDVLGEFDAKTEMQNENLIRGAIKGAGETPIVFDTVGLGGPVADTFRDEGFTVERFDSSTTAKDDERYYNKRAEAFGTLGDWLATEEGAVQPGTTLASELYGVSESMEYIEKALKSGTTWKVTPKDELKKADALGESPDHADACAMAVWGKEHAGTASDASFSIYSITE